VRSLSLSAVIALRGLIPAMDAVGSGAEGVESGQALEVSRGGRNCSHLLSPSSSRTTARPLLGISLVVAFSRLIKQQHARAREKKGHALLPRARRKGRKQGDAERTCRFAVCLVSTHAHRLFHLFCASDPLIISRLRGPRDRLEASYYLDTLFGVALTLADNSSYSIPSDGIRESISMTYEKVFFEDTSSG
jgi:hypothetical protein